MQRYEGVWRKRYLLPSWILQIICAIVFVVVAGLLLAAASYVQRHHRSSSYNSSSNYSYYGYSSDQLVEYARISGGVALGLGLGTIIFDITEIVLYARRRLNPILLLSSACIKTLVWGAYFVIIAIGAAYGSVSVLDIILSLVLALTSIEQLVLGAVYTHRKRQGRLIGRDTSPKTAEFEGSTAYGGAV
ncbi:hypothetical protein F4821DRAFT_25805 [Hypoxylon rubiginosum]|uniref:Uncharacterized protein n=1 Tax=Hypoxylon rubiginosum TaxID=110542 RepID=A0ACC0CLZ7_9PEZI|nr:hypothetical protein F4821DRAFT_25805 [Hypoxylon rubiginosum]